MQIEEMYRRKGILEKKLYNLIKGFEKDCQVFVSDLSFYNSVNAQYNKEEYDSIQLRVELDNKIEVSE